MHLENKFGLLDATIIGGTAETLLESNAHAIMDYLQRVKPKFQHPISIVA